MDKHIIALLQLFRDRMPDRETNVWVLELATDSKKWADAHDLFSAIRKRNLSAIFWGNALKQSQYCFEETCLKALYNESGSRGPFDSDSPYWIVPLAMELSRKVEVSVESITDIVAPIHRH